MTNSRIRTKDAVLGILSNVAQQIGVSGDDISIRLVAPLVGAELGTWKVIEKDGIAHLEIDESAGGGQATVNVALMNAPQSSGDEDTGVSVVVNSGTHALVKRSASPGWVYLTYERSAPQTEDSPKLFTTDDSAKPAQKNTNGLRPTVSARKLADLAAKDDGYEASNFLDPAFKSTDELLMKSLSYVRSKLFGLKLSDDDVIYLLDRDVIDRKSARDALKWNAFVTWATPIIDGKESIPESVVGLWSVTGDKCLTRTAQTEERIWPKSFGSVVQFNDGIDLNSFLRNVNDDWYDGKLSSSQVDLLNQLHFVISNRHGAKFNTSQVRDLFNVIQHVMSGGSISDPDESIRKSTIRAWQSQITTGEIDELMLLILGVLGIGPAFERLFRSKATQERSESTSEQALDAPTSAQNAEDGSESAEQTPEPQKAVRRPAARKDQPKPANGHVGLAPSSKVRPFGSSLLSDLTEGSSFQENRAQVKRSRARRKQ